MVTRANQGNYEQAILENENNNYIIDDYSDYEPEHKHYLSVGASDNLLVRLSTLRMKQTCLRLWQHMTCWFCSAVS